MNLMELYIDFETKWQEDEFGVCDCPPEIDDDHPFPCKHAPSDKIFKNWIDNQETRFFELLKLIGITN